MALTDMQQEWGSRLRWTGSPSCNWNYLYCDSNGHVYLLYVHIIFREFLLSHILRYSWNTNHYFPLIYFSTQTPNLIFMITNYASINLIFLFFIFFFYLHFSFADTFLTLDWQVQFPILLEIFKLSFGCTFKIQNEIEKKSQQKIRTNTLTLFTITNYQLISNII